jgi:hypothetical protein
MQIGYGKRGLLEFERGSELYYKLCVAWHDHDLGAENTRSSLYKKCPEPCILTTTPPSPLRTPCLSSESLGWLHSVCLVLLADPSLHL